MGWCYRKSLNFGPFRVNLSKSGIGYSVGGLGFRTGVRAGGRRYSSFSIPGTGLRYMTTRSGGRSTGCLLMLALPVTIGLLVAWLMR